MGRADLSEMELTAIHPELSTDVHRVLTVSGSIASRDAYGGTAPERVGEQLQHARRAVTDHRAWAAE